jgi:hypothetical protein
MQKSCLAVKKRRNGEKIVDIRSQVKALHVLSNDGLELTVRHGKGPELKPAEIIKNVFTLHDGQIEGMRVLKTKSLII